MKMILVKNHLFIFIFLLSIFFWSLWIVKTHPTGAIVSWDEGFHGGSALYISKALEDNFSFTKYRYILDDFINGVIWYPPLWLVVAGPMGAIFGPSVAAYRFTTLLFAISSLLMIYFVTNKYAGGKGALIAITTLAFTPIFIVYSHLMMLEVPLLFSVSFALLLYWRFLNRERLTIHDILLTTFAFIVGVSSKVVAMPIITLTVLFFGIFLLIFYRKTLLCKRFFSLWTLLFLVSGALAFFGYRYFIKSAFHVDILMFHINQTKQLSGSHTLFESILSIFISSLRIYLNDFLRMPILTLFWFGSFVAYVLWKRMLIGYFLLTWALVTYLTFSAVRPLDTQYILSIFAPISIASGLFWGKILGTKYRVKPMILVSCFILIIAMLGLSSLKKSVTLPWRNLITNQEAAANYVANHAFSGDRVISSGDGTRFLIRMAANNKKLQTINGAAPVCFMSIADSTDWALVDFGQQNPVRLLGIYEPQWIHLATYPGTIEDTYVFKNINESQNTIIQGNNLVSNNCSRVLPLGRNHITFFVAPRFQAVKQDETDLKINIFTYENKLVKDISINHSDLIENKNVEQQFSMDFDNNQINRAVKFDFDLPKDLLLVVRKIEIDHQDN